MICSPRSAFKAWCANPNSISRLTRTTTQLSTWRQWATVCRRPAPRCQLPSWSSSSRTSLWLQTKWMKRSWTMVDSSTTRLPRHFRRLMNTSWSFWPTQRRLGSKTCRQRGRRWFLSLSRRVRATECVRLRIACTGRLTRRLLCCRRRFLSLPRHWTLSCKQTLSLPRNSMNSSETF